MDLNHQDQRLLRMLVAGLSVTAIAGGLGFSVRLIEAQIMILNRKLGEMTYADALREIERRRETGDDL